MDKAFRICWPQRSSRFRTFTIITLQSQTAVIKEPGSGGFRPSVWLFTTRHKRFFIMMFSKLAIFFISTAALVSALPGGENVFNSQSGKCNVGKLECCELASSLNLYHNWIVNHISGKSVQDAKSEAVQKVLGKLNAAVGDVRGMVGLNCDAISVLGVGTASNWYVLLSASFNLLFTDSNLLEAMPNLSAAKATTSVSIRFFDDLLRCC